MYRIDCMRYLLVNILKWEYHTSKPITNSKLIAVLTRKDTFLTLLAFTDFLVGLTRNFVWKDQFQMINRGNCEMIGQASLRN